MLGFDADSLRRRAIDARRSARGAMTAELRRQFLELADGFDELAGAVQSFYGVSEIVAPPADGSRTRAPDSNNPRGPRGLALHVGSDGDRRARLGAGRPIA